MPAKFLTGFVAATFLVTPIVFAADQAQKRSKESDEVAQAIAFERQKDAAAARQLRIEAKHSTATQTNSGADREKAKSDKSGEKNPKK